MVIYMEQIQSKLKKVEIMNTSYTNVTLQEAVELAEHFVQNQQKAYIVAVNADVCMRIENDPYLKEITDAADMVLADGKPIVWISKLYKRPLKERVTGSDLVPALCALSAERGYSVYILGGKEGIAEQAKANLEQKYPGINVCGTYSPPFGFEKDAAELANIREKISASKPDFMIACFGCPKQEKFIYENYANYDAYVSVCAGATVDFLAGNVKRAPKWMQNHGLEWLFRITQDPKRLIKRYLIDDTKIIRLIFKYRNRK